jgi:hypothetical protein
MVAHALGKLCSYDQLAFSVYIGSDEKNEKGREFVRFKKMLAISKRCETSILMPGRLRFVL